MDGVIIYMLSTELKKSGDELGFTYNDQWKAIYGKYNGYQTIISENSRFKSYFIKVPCRVEEDSQKRFLNDFLKELTNNSNVRTANYANRCITIELAGNSEDDTRNIVTVLGQVINFIQINNYEPCCEVCGSNTETSIKPIYDNKLCICDECYSKIDISAMETKKTGSNIVGGIAGALMGSLIGVFLWVVVYNLGAIAVICGVVLAICTIKGYELVGGELDTKGIVISVVIILAMVYLSTYISYGVVICKVVDKVDSVDLVDAFRNASLYLNKYDKVRSSFIKDLTVGYIFTIVGTVSTIFKIMD